MRLRNIAGSREAIGESDFVIHEPENQKGNWQKILVIIILYTLKLEWGKAGF